VDHIIVSAIIDTGGGEDAVFQAAETQ